MSKILNMTVGQTEIHPVIKSTINDSIPVPTYFKEYKDIQEEMLKRAQQILNTKMPVYVKLGIGRVGLETGLYNILDENTRVLTIDNGQWGNFGGVLASNMGAEVDFLVGQKGKQIDYIKLKEKLLGNRYDIVTMVHNETQTGCLYDVKKVREIINEVSEEILLFVDGISCFGGTRVMFDEWGIDVYVTGSQKCLNAPQGSPLVCYSKKALARMDKVNINKKFYFSMALDNNPEFLFVRGLNDLFKNLLEEGLENVYSRHYIAAKAVREAIKILGLSYMADEEVVSPSTTRIVFPNDLQRLIDEDREKFGIDGDRVTRVMKDKYGVCIAEDRIGTMGYYTREEDIIRTIEALSDTLNDLGYLNNKQDAINIVRYIYKADTAACCKE